MTRNDISGLDDERTSKARSITLSERLPEVAEALKQAHIGEVTIGYRARPEGDSRYYILGWTLAMPRLPAVKAELLAFFQELQEVRYPGWAHVKGACGVFTWDLTPDTLRHTHVVHLGYRNDGYSIDDVTVLKGL